jgi:hypothetical protein
VSTHLFQLIMQKVLCMSNRFGLSIYGGDFAETICSPTTC